MKLEAGKMYRTRGGFKAHIFGTSPFTDWAIGTIEGSTLGESWRPNGNYLNCGTRSDRDLISEWREPVSKTVHLWINADGFVQAYWGDGTPAPTIPNPTGHSVVTITEGMKVKHG
jgi:hypothetical protein